MAASASVRGANNPAAPSTSAGPQRASRPSLRSTAGGTRRARAFLVRLDAPLYLALRARAFAEHESLASIVRRALREELERG